MLTEQRSASDQVSMGPRGVEAQSCARVRSRHRSCAADLPSGAR